jgi:hypothetical protein
MSQPFRVTRIGKSGEMQCELVRGSGDNGVHFATECKLNGSLHCMSGNAAGPDGAISVGRGVA